MELTNIYNKSTGVNIEEQWALWDKRGKGYYGEFLLFCRLYNDIEGDCKILLNLNIPTEYSTTTEVDLLLIHETGLYVFECKHFNGCIKGRNSDKTWTQYFRTGKSNIFINPIHQNQYHLDALKGLFPKLPIHSFIVFTNEDCVLKVNNTNSNINVINIKDLDSALHYRFSTNKECLTAEKISDIFDSLIKYSPMKDPVTVDGVESSFNDWVQPCINALKEQSEKLSKETKSIACHKKRGIIMNVIVALLCVIALVLSLIKLDSSYRQKTDQNSAELDQFKQKFLHVDKTNDSDISDLGFMVSITDVELKQQKGAASLKATITFDYINYFITANKDAKYIVMTSSGNIYEYDVHNNDKTYSAYDFILGDYHSKQKSIEKVFTGINKSETITYIKLTGISLYEKSGYAKSLIKEDLEIELFSRK